LGEPAFPAFCCEGCRAVYGILHDAGLEAYYQERAEAGGDARPATLPTTSSGELDDPEFLATNTRELGPDVREVELLVENLHCAACVWLIERLPRVLPAVSSASVDLGRSSVRVVWSPSAAPLSDVGRALGSLGYPAHALKRSAKIELERRENRALLLRLGVAGACFGNVMLMALALYSGESGGMDREWETFFRWGSALTATPAVAFSGATFFRGAWAALRTRTPHMDLPVSAGILVGWGSGVVNVVRGVGDVYFDSIAAVIFLLLVGRHLERRQMQRASNASELLTGLAPSHARVIEEDGVREVAIEAVERGALLEVLAGDRVPADGVVTRGESAVDSSLLTGESLPEEVAPGSKLAAGTINVTARIEMRAEKTGHATRLAELARHVEEASRRRAPIATLANRAAGRFVVGVLVLAALTFVAWSAIDPSRALDSTIALLVVTCPCALGLATPLAVSSALGRAARRGILVRGGAPLEALAQPSLLVFDKTGTLTEGQLDLVAWYGTRDVFELALALEAHSSHPIAKAFARAGTPLVRELREFTQAPGGGLEATVGTRRVVVGSLAFVQARASLDPELERLALARAREAETPVLVAVDGYAVGLACFADVIRADAQASLEALARMGHRFAIASGDRQEVVDSVARRLGVPFEAVLGGQSPHDKLACIERALSKGPVVMVGDGVNDAAALARSTVGIAVHGGAEASLSAAHVFTTKPGVSAVHEIFAGARRTLAVIRRNLSVSLAYNLVCATLAVTGHVSPLLAAILMPLSSLTVVLSSYRSRTFEA
jgi:Cu2+-exporting ATPase